MSKRQTYNHFKLTFQNMDQHTGLPTRGYISGLILGLRPAKERRRYFVTTSLIGWAQTLNHPCISSNA